LGVCGPDPARPNPSVVLALCDSAVELTKHGDNIACACGVGACVAPDLGATTEGPPAGLPSVTRPHTRSPHNDTPPLPCPVRPRPCHPSVLRVRGALEEATTSMDDAPSEPVFLFGLGSPGQASPSKVWGLAPFGIGFAAALSHARAAGVASCVAPPPLRSAPLRSGGPLHVPRRE
jgi:hypothetical protein